MLNLIKGRSLWVLVLLTICVAVSFAWFTEHVWEDYYITFRSSKNLAQGHGLVFNVGDRVHTFTSPLGVLLPALAAWMSGTNSDFAALWLFRAMSIAALAGAVGLIVQIGRRLELPWLGWGLAGVWLATDAKTIDFSINGMETGFLVLFLLYAFWAHVRGPNHWRHQGLAWAGMMWTRPDCFIYVALMAGAVALFGNGLKRYSLRELVGGWLKAGALTTALYLPWILWAWSYYGSPIPHTVAAKSGIADPFTWFAFGKSTLQVPFAFFGFDDSLGATFLPSYFQLGGWSSWMLATGKAIAGIVSICWILPWVSARTRLCSFIFFGVHAYLSYFPYFPFPWYIPAATPFGILSGCSLLSDIWVAAETKRRFLRPVIAGVVGVIALGSAGLTYLVAQQLQVQQDLVENQTRRAIGEYLHDHGTPEDTVFTEPLGYVGYFSGFRTYDYPGMSSPEMVAARKITGGQWSDVIGYLRPDWIVLRPHEFERLQHGRPDWRLENGYERVVEFDNRAAVDSSDVYGKGYLAHDAVFWVFRRIHNVSHEAAGWRSRSDFGVNPASYRDRDVLFTHAEAEICFEIPADSRSFSIGFGFTDNAESSEIPSDGARFGFEIRDGTTITPLRWIDVRPFRDADKFHYQNIECDLPEMFSENAVLRVVVEARESTNRDWTYITKPEFRSALSMAAHSR